MRARTRRVAGSFPLDVDRRHAAHTTQPIRHELVDSSTMSDSVLAVRDLLLQTSSRLPANSSTRAQADEAEAHSTICSAVIGSDVTRTP